MFGILRITNGRHDWSERQLMITGARDSKTEIAGIVRQLIKYVRQLIMLMPNLTQSFS